MESKHISQNTTHNFPVLFYRACMQDKTAVLYTAVWQQHSSICQGHQVKGQHSEAIRINFLILDGLAKDFSLKQRCIISGANRCLSCLC